MTVALDVQGSSKDDHRDHGIFTAVLSFRPWTALETISPPQNDSPLNSAVLRVSLTISLAVIDLPRVLQCGVGGSAPLCHPREECAWGFNLCCIALLTMNFELLVLRPST